MTKIGDNSGVAADQLKQFVEQIEQAQEEQRRAAQDVSEFKKAAKAAGFDMKALNEMLRLRRMDADERAEREALRDLYASALELFQ